MSRFTSRFRTISLATVFDALRDHSFSGRCECYSGEHFTIPGERLFTVGVMLRRPGRKATPDYAWWMKVVKSVAQHALRYKNSITFAPDLSELSRKRAMLSTFIPSGIAEFADGHVSRVFDSEERSLLFSYYCEQKPLA